MKNQVENWVDGKDAAYCKGCVFRADTWPVGRNLCDYMIKTGRRRGCPPGVGCTKRTVIKEKKS